MILVKMVYFEEMTKWDIELFESIAKESLDLEEAINEFNLEQNVDL